MPCVRAADGDSLLISASSSPPESDSKPKRRSFASKALRVLGCASSASSDACAPAASAVRSSAEWQGKRSRRRRQKQSSRNNKKERREHQAAPAVAVTAAASRDVWYAQEFGDDSMDCMNRHHPMMMVGMGGRHETERIHREIMMFQNRIVSGRMNSYDRHRDWRLDVDRMSYEELLELGDRIGYVNTGLREEQISRSLSRMKHSVLGASPLYFSTEMEKKCSICQEEYEVNDEMGKLKCGHSYHMCCIKQWLLQKNACPVCKTAVTAT